MALMRTRGQVGLVTVDGTLCGGTLACRIGDDLFSLVNAHDPAYDGFSMGSLSRYLMITASIHAGAKRFHLLGGQLRIKQAMHGEKQRLDHLLGGARSITRVPGWRNSQGDSSDYQHGWRYALLI
eukprot:gene3875-5124_t